jgi:hypothetical protein
VVIIGDALDHGDSQERFHVHIMGMGRHGVLQEDDQVDFSFGDHGALHAHFR